jgi:hypothetical protein
MIPSFPQRPGRRSPVTAATPTRLHRRACRLSRCRLVPTTQMGCARRELSPGLGLIQDGARTAKIGQRR